MSTTISLLGPGRSSARPDTISPADFMTIADVVRARSGIVLGLDKAYLVESRLEQLVRSRHYTGLAELAARLRTHPNGALAHEIVDAMTTNETLFFRDAKPFAHLRHHLPVLHAAYPPTQSLRIWSAAASSGQECYSIAITVLEAGLGTRPVQILGTDISTEQIARAKLGLYSEFEVQRGLSTPNLIKYFRKESGGWRISDPVRRLVEFRKWNLMEDLRPLGMFDLVFCRNVLIYFDLQTKRRVLAGIWERMAPGGLLYLGGAETTFGVTDRFVPCPGANQVYSAVPSQVPGT
jgi:chemotaxis protein methyltransferase CheR